MNETPFTFSVFLTLECVRSAEHFAESGKLCGNKKIISWHLETCHALYESENIISKWFLLWMRHKKLHVHTVSTLISRLLMMEKRKKKNLFTLEFYSLHIETFKRVVPGSLSLFCSSALLRYAWITQALDSTAGEKKEKRIKRIEQFIFIWNFILFVSKNCARNAIESISIVTFFSILFHCHSEESIATKIYCFFYAFKCAVCVCASRYKFTYMWREILTLNEYA